MRTPKRPVEEIESGNTPNYYGLTKLGWYSLTPEERVIHYNRQEVCEHKADILSWPELLREEWSHDPYAHTAHLLPHSVEAFKAGTCECQTCVGKFGIPRDQEKRVVDVDVLREKLKSVTPPEAGK